MAKVLRSRQMQARIAQVTRHLAELPYWCPSKPILDSIGGPLKADRIQVTEAIKAMVADGDLLRRGKPPRGCSYRLAHAQPVSAPAIEPPVEPLPPAVDPPVKLPKPLGFVVSIPPPRKIHPVRTGICFVRLCVDFHGLQLPNMDDVERLRALILACARSHHPGMRFDSDVEVDVELTAGEPIR